MTPGLVLGASATAAPAYSQPFQAPDKPNKPNKPDKPGPDRPGAQKPDRGDRSDKADKPKKRKKPDRTAPAAPSVGGSSAGAGGLVSVFVSTEPGASLVLRQVGRGVVARTGGSGSATVSWYAATGTHYYSVRAIDGAGNASRASKFSAVADATPPPLSSTKVKQGNPKDTRSRVAFTTIPGARYRILVDGKVHHAGTTGQRRVKETLGVRNGRHQVTVQVLDQVGNINSSTRPLRVRIRKLALETRMTSENTDTTQILRVEGTPNATTGRLTVPGERSWKFRMVRGVGDVKLELPDGSYEGVTVVVRDRQGRRGRVKLPQMLIDTTPPVLSVDRDAGAADDGKLAMTVTAEEEATVTWSLLAGGRRVETGKFVSDGEDRTIERDVAEGDYELAVSATDGFDRTTTDVAPTSIAPDPTSPILVALVILVLAAVVGGLVRVFLLLRRRRPRWVEDAKERVTEVVETRRAQVQTIVAQRRRVTAYEEAEQRWQRRQEALLTVLAAAEGAEVSSPVLLPDVSLLPHEHVRLTVPARLFHALDDDAPEMTLEAEDGELVVTNLRFSFVGGEERDWWCALVERVRHDGPDRTLVKQWNDEAWVGLLYADPEETRLHLDLAMAEQHGTKAAFVERVNRALADHELRRPTPDRVGVDV